MNYEFYRGAVSVDSDDASLYETFCLDPFLSRNLTLNKDQVTYILDRFRLKKYISKTAIASSVFSCLYESMGGKADTSPQEVAAFTYICFTSHNFQFQSIFEQMLNAIRVENIFSYLEDISAVVPGSVIQLLGADLKPFIWSQIIDRHDFIVDASARLSAEETLNKISEIEVDTTAYIDNLKDTDSLLNKLDIDLSKE